MKTKTRLITAAISGLLVMASLGALNTGPERSEAQLTFLVKDDFGKPVTGVEVKAYTFSHWDPKKKDDVYDVYKGITDADGEVVLKGQSLTGQFSYNITGGEKYYLIGVAGREHCFAEKKNGRWEPWNPTIEIIYKPVMKPISMYSGGGRKTIPIKEKEVGYDLMKNDWVEPYGKGEQGDLIFKLEEKKPYESAYKPYDYRLKISFPSVGDGMQSWHGPKYKGEMDMPRYAPTEGYQNSLELRAGRDEKGYFKKRDDQNYFIRVRTILNDKGEVQSALYGKMEGNIQFDDTGFMEFAYYLNPNLLDTNMEHDRKNDLLIINDAQANQKNLRANQSH